MFRYLCAIAIWLLVPLAVFALPFDAPGTTCAAMAYLYAGAPLLALVFFILFFATRKKASAATALLIVLSMWPASWYFGFGFGARVHLFVNEGRYAEKIRQLNQAKTEKEKDRICGDQCLARSDKPLVTFHYCHCFSFWPDLVYDPAGDLRGNRDELQKLDFYLHDARHLKTFWYIGYFGD